MAHISGFERDQLLLLPEVVDDYVGANNSVRFFLSPQVERTLARHRAASTAQGGDALDRRPELAKAPARARALKMPGCRRQARRPLA
jgi:hypothetical protein